MGIELARGHRLEINQLIALIDSRAAQINALQQRLTAQAQDSDPTTARLLEQARAAIDAGELDQAEQVLDQADTAAANAIDNAQRRRAEVISLEAQVKAAEFDYLGAADKYAAAAALLPASDTHDRWQYVVEQARTLPTGRETRTT
jgi:phage shock protein A